MNKLFLSGIVLSSVAVASIATAAEFKPTSVRALGMGGSNVASTNGVDATYWNPAAYGFFDEDDSSAEMKSVDNNGMSDKDYGVDVGVGAGLYLFGPIADNVNVLESLTLPGGTASAGLSATEIVDTANFINTFKGLDPQAGGINFAADTTVGARIFNYGLGVRSSIDVNVSVSIDNNNVGLGPDFFTALTAAPVTVPAIPGVTPYFDATQQGDLVTALENTGMSTVDATSVATNYNNALTVQADATAAAALGSTVDPTLVGNQAAMSQALVDLASAPGNLQNNATTFRALGVLLTEVGFTYGYAFDESLSVGGVLKYMQADMIVPDSVSAFGSSSATSPDLTSRESVSNVGLDLGLMYRLPAWQFGLTVRNLNSPSFESSTGYVYELKPQAKVGAAWIPMDTVTVELGYDLTENEGAVPSSKTQYWNIGAEWNAFDILALRVGAFENTAQSDIGLVGTLGLGLNLWAARLDVGAAVSPKKTEIVGANIPFFGDNIPHYFMTSATLAVDF